MPPHSSQYCFKIIQTINVLVEFFLFTCNPFISIEISLFLQLDFSVTFAKIFYYCYKNCSGETNTCKCRPYCIMHKMSIDNSSELLLFCTYLWLRLFLHWWCLRTKCSCSDNKSKTFHSIESISEFFGLSYLINYVEVWLKEKLKWWEHKFSQYLIQNQILTDSRVWTRT